MKRNMLAQNVGNRVLLALAAGHQERRKAG